MLESKNGKFSLSDEIREGGCSRVNLIALLFCLTWTLSRSAQEVADTMDMTVRSVRARGRSYIKKGILLKAM